jgi:integrase-like protein
LYPEGRGHRPPALRTFNPGRGSFTYLGTVLGLRWGECAGLKVGRLDFLRSTLTVAWQRTRGPGGEMIEGPPKSAAGNRTLAVPTPLMEMLSRHLARRRLTGVHVDAYVFVAPEGGPLGYSHFRDRVWLPACNAGGLTGLRFHDLRHANATGLVADGVDVKTAQTRLGHSDPRLTLAIYAQAVTEADRAAADKLAQRFMPCEVPVHLRGPSSGTSATAGRDAATQRRSRLLSPLTKQLAVERLDGEHVPGHRVPRSWPSCRRGSRPRPCGPTFILQRTGIPHCKSEISRFSEVSRRVTGFAGSATVKSCGGGGRKGEADSLGEARGHFGQSPSQARWHLNWLLDPFEPVARLLLLGPCPLPRCEAPHPLPNALCGTVERERLDLGAQDVDTHCIRRLLDQGLPSRDTAEGEDHHLFPTELASPRVEPDHGLLFFSTEEDHVVIRGDDYLARPARVLQDGAVLRSPRRGLVVGVADEADVEAERAQGSCHPRGQQLVEEQPERRQAPTSRDRLSTFYAAASPASTSSRSKLIAARTSSGSSS